MIFNELTTKVFTLHSRLIVGASALLMALFFNLWIADANGIGSVVRDEVVGPYHVRVGITPFPAQTGRTIMSISLEDTQGEPVQQGRIVALARGPAESSQNNLMMGFSTDSWDLFHYHSAVELADPGMWTFDIQIDGQLGEADMQLPIEFVPEMDSGASDDFPILPMAIFAAVVLFSIALGVTVRVLRSR